MKREEIRDRQEKRGGATSASSEENTWGGKKGAWWSKTSKNVCELLGQVVGRMRRNKFLRPGNTGGEGWGRDFYN